MTSKHSMLSSTDLPYTKLGNFHYFFDQTLFYRKCDLEANPHANTKNGMYLMKYLQNFMRITQHEAGSIDSPEQLLYVIARIFHCCSVLR